MKQIYRYLAVAAVTALFSPAVEILAQTGEKDPASVVEKWSDASTSPKIIDINFSDTSWPNTWGNSGSGRDCPEYDSGVYVNAVLSTPVLGAEGVKYPLLFHNCVFATTASNNGFAAATAAFARQYYEGQKATTNNDWKQPGHTVYLEDNITYSNGKPVKGEAGFVQMCRNKSVDGATSLHGWVEIDHIPYVERIQWSWSATSWGRGIKCDIKVGDGDWTPLVWMGSEKHKMGFTVFSDQGYFMENVIDKKDVSLRWRVWDGDGKAGADDQVQKADFAWQTIDPLAERQAPRLHKLRIFGDVITAEQAEYAKNNPVGDVGELTDLSKFDFTGGGDDEQTPAPDADAPVSFIYVNPDGSGDYTTIQAAINSVADGSRGIIYIAPGVYEENIYCGTKEKHSKFISLIGSDPSTTILTSSVDRGGNNGKSYLDCAALNVFTDRFYAENLTIRNTSGDVGQAEALYTAGDAHVFKNCVLSGYQDTYKANDSMRGYFTNCTISGATDFIYDGGLEWFEGCRIVCVLAKGGYITAPANSALTLTKAFYPELGSDVVHAGLFFRDCDITAEKGVGDGTYYLGRPWKENSGAMFIRCRIGTHINPRGWKEWSGSENSASFIEYKNTDPAGAALDTSRRASFSRQAADAEAEEYFTPEFLFAKASKVSFDFKTIVKGAAAPYNFTITPSVFSWESDEKADRKSVV